MVLILGPEGSGTRILTRLFVDAGCSGDYGHEQRLDIEQPDSDLIVYRRSYPHLQVWPDLQEIKKRFSDYVIQAIVIIRSFQFTIASGLKHAGGQLEHAKQRATEALFRILYDLRNNNISYFWITYESLVNSPKRELVWLMSQFNLIVPETYIYNGNDK